MREEKAYEEVLTRGECFKVALEKCKPLYSFSSPIAV
jgi:hypothetical protein